MYMLDWLYDIFVAIVTFVMSLFGFDLDKRSVALESAPKEPAEEVKEPVEPVAEPAETATELP